MEAYVLESSHGVFDESRDCFEGMVSWLDSQDATELTHGELEAQLQLRGRELLRQLTQDHLDRRAHRERRLAEVLGADGVRRGSAEIGRVRGLSTVFGPVTVRWITYREPGYASLYPAEGMLNLPVERHSYGLRLLAARESARGAFAEAAEAIGRVTGLELGNRQVEELTQRAAVDFDQFYAQRRWQLSLASDVLVLSYDGKGIVMRPQARRPATARAAARATPKLATRLSRGEKRHRKRMAEVGSVYDLTPVPRTAQDILSGADRAPRKGPSARGKWLVASITADADEVIGQVFDEATRRDPEHRRRWIVLVDGHPHQIDRTHAQARDHHAEVTILIDFVHVLEYVWKPAWCFFAEGDPEVERWVATHGLDILKGHPDQVAAALQRQATHAGLGPAQRAAADTCARYLINKHPYLDYPTALARGWPLATGVIEGACRHLVAHRMDLTGARWTLPSAEAVLKLRALQSNGDFDDYWAYHLTQEKHRVHQTRYANEVIPAA